MRAMKDSGVNWIGKFPNDWKAVRLKYLMNNLDWQRVPVDANKRAQDGDELYDYYGASGIIDKINGYTTEGRNILIGEDGANLVLRNLPLIYIAEGKYWVNNHAHILHPKDGHYLDFFAFQMEIIDYSLYITGSAQPKLSQANLNNVILAVPSQKEQNYIATYLQKRLFEINSTMSDLQHQIELLQEYKQSVITEAVTKGLDKNVAMKDSHVYWIGHIPTHWELIKIKYLISIENGSDPLQDGDIPVYGSGTDSFKTCGEYKEGPTVLLGRKGTINIPRYINERYWNVDTAFNTVKKSENISLKFFYYLATCFDYNYYMSQTTLPSMTQTAYNNMTIPYPCYDEQREIVDYLDEKCSKINAVLADKQKQLDTLTEYKKSLIYEYVTGKKEVPADA